MSIVIFVIVLVVAFFIGIGIGILLARKSLRLSALGTVMIQDDEDHENMYIVWNDELEDILKYDIGIVRIKKFGSPK